MKANTMKSYRRDQLKKEALEACGFRGHKMKRFKNDTDSRHSKAYSECRVCGKTVHVDACPMPNGIDISGEAVALGCGD